MFIVCIFSCSRNANEIRSLSCGLEKAVKAKKGGYLKCLDLHSLYAYKVNLQKHFIPLFTCFTPANILKMHFFFYSHISLNFKNVYKLQDYTQKIIDCHIAAVLAVFSHTFVRTRTHIDMHTHTHEPRQKQNTH